MLTESISELATPPLTTIEFPADELGRIAARILIDQLDGRETADQHILMQPALNIRGSTGAPREAAPSRA